MPIEITEDFIVRNNDPLEEVPNISMGQFLFEVLKSFDPDRKLYIDQESEVTLTAGDLLDRALRLATVLIKKFPDLDKQKDVAVFHSVNSLELITVQFAISFLGLTYSPVTINCKAYELNRQVADSGGTLLFYSADYAEVVDQVAPEHADQLKLVCLLDGEQDGVVTFKDLLQEGSEMDLIEQVPYFEVDPKEDLCLVLYTSGSTGLPKGAAQTHFALLSVAFIMAPYQLSPYGQFVQEEFRDDIEEAEANQLYDFFFFPLAHTSGQVLLLWNLLRGSVSVVNGHPKPEVICRGVEEFRMKRLGINPALAQFLVTEPVVDKYDLSSLKIMMTGGSNFAESLARKLMEKFGVTMEEFYGATEVGIITRRGADDEYYPRVIGGPMKGVQIKVVDLISFEALPPHSEGELWIKTDGIIRCYINRPEATRDAVTDDGWYRTGDIGYYDERGMFLLCDRVKEMIKYMSYAVYPAEVEQVLSLHPAVLESIVVPVPDPVYNELPRAYVKLRNGYKFLKNSQINGQLADNNNEEFVTEQELIDHVAEHLAEQKQIRGGVVLWEGDIPRVSIGKPDRQFFKKLAREEANL